MKPFCQTFFQNGFNFIREAVPLEELELEPFLMEPELCQTGSYTQHHWAALVTGSAGPA
jgi:hypothetical protein